MKIIFLLLFLIPVFAFAQNGQIKQKQVKDLADTFGTRPDTFHLMKVDITGAVNNDEAYIDLSDTTLRFRTPGGGGSQDLQQVLTTGSTLTTNNTIAYGTNSLSFTGNAGSNRLVLSSQNSKMYGNNGLNTIETGGVAGNVKINSANEVEITSLAGTGTRMVTVNPSGYLFYAAIPSGGGGGVTFAQVDSLIGPRGYGYPVTRCYFTTSSDTVYLYSDIPGTTFTWQGWLITGDALTITGIGTGSGNKIYDHITNSSSEIAIIRYVVIPTANGVQGHTFSVDVAVSPGLNLYTEPSAVISSGIWGPTFLLTNKSSGSCRITRKFLESKISGFTGTHVDFYTIDLHSGGPTMPVFTLISSYPYTASTDTTHIAVVAYDDCGDTWSDQFDVSFGRLNGPYTATITPTASLTAAPFYVPFPLIHLDIQHRKMCPFYLLTFDWAIIPSQ